jgi:hypothetical protein
MADNLVVKSPLKAWPGGIELPKPDDFSGVHWQVYKRAYNKKKRAGYAQTHQQCYSGLELIKAVDGWHFDDITIDEVQAWESEPEDERIKLVAWIGKTIMLYIDSIIDPKG